MLFSATTHKLDFCVNAMKQVSLKGKEVSNVFVLRGLTILNDK